MDEDMNIVLKPYKCDTDAECEFCEYWIWCKGENKENAGSI